jgi:hypothetical protein
MVSLPPVSLTSVKICHWSQFAADVIYTGGKFATIVIDTREANLLPVLLIPVVHLDLQISLRIIKYGMLCYPTGPSDIKNGL